MPNELEISCARSWDTIELKMSTMLLPSSRPVYTRMLAFGASPIACSMSSAASPSPSGEHGFVHVTGALSIATLVIGTLVP